MVACGLSGVLCVCHSREGPPALCFTCALGGVPRTLAVDRLEVVCCVVVESCFSLPFQWKKHWFVLADQSLRYYRDSVAEEVSVLG